MIATIVPFELRYRFSNQLTYLVLLMMAAQGIWYAIGIYDFCTSDEALMNGSGVFYQCLAGGGMLLIIVVAMITGTTLHRDVACGAADYIYAMPMDEKRFFLGHFISAYIINLLVTACYPVGMAVMQYSGVGEPHLFGPTPWAQLVHGYIIFCVPNLFLLTVTCFFCLVFTKRMSAVYVGVAGVSILFLVGEAMSNNSPYINILAVMDPFGYVYAKHTVGHMPVALKNSGYLPVTWVFIVNRLFWFCISLVALILCYRKFSFRYFIQPPISKKNEQDAPCTFLADNDFGKGSLPVVAHRYSAKESWRKVFRLAVTEFKAVVRPTSFKIIYGIVVLVILLQNLLWNSTYYIGHQVPLTSGMTNVRLVNGFLFMVILMILSGELFFKERISGFWQITGTTPAPNWVLQLPKLLAMFGVAFLFALAIFLGGLIAQTIQGFWDIDWLLYLGDVFGYKFGWITYMLNIVTVFFLAGLLGNRYLTHVLAVGYFIFLLISFDLGIFEELRFGYALTPGMEDYSELSGYGIWSRASFWYFLLWFSLAIAMVLAALQLWQRGTGQHFFSRRRFIGGELSLQAKGTLAVSLVAFFLLQGFIVQKVNALRNFIPTEQADSEAALYEQKYGPNNRNNQLLKELLEIRADFYPEERKAKYSATIRLTSFSPEPVSRLYVNIDSHTTVSSITVQQQPLEKVEGNPVLGMQVYRLPKPIEKGQEVLLFFDASRSYSGFTQSGDDPQADLTFNGLFFTKTIPFIGFDRDKSLLDNRDRETYQLAKMKSRLAPINDTDGLQRTFISSWSRPRTKDGVLHITVSTSGSQQPLAPGLLVRTWEENGRNYGYFKVSKPGAVQPNLGSGQYRQLVKGINGVRVTFLHHPEHVYNLGEFEHGIEAGLKFIIKEMGPYPYHELRIVEIPFYNDPSYAMANTIALSEKEGWYADCTVDEMRGVVQYILARDLLRQWLAANGTIADVQGADMLWTALPSALALQVVEERLGEPRVEELFTKMRRKYRKERTSEPNIEPPLIYGDHIDYLEQNKGTMALYKLSKSIGFVKFNRHVKNWIESSQGPLVFQDLYTSIKKTYFLDKETENLFEKVEQEVAL